ncbi:MAG TPA: trypsin-like peptidase domain-containing protein [bacterium]|nr:trypsin-like peptidase domain-containing protein [bacterium]
MIDPALLRLRAVLQDRRDELLARPNVVATGLGYKTRGGRREPTLAIICSVAHKLPPSALSARELVPPVVDGAPTDVVATGPIWALQARTARHRPAPGGVSVGHRDITAGTFGCLVQRDGTALILSNNHVLANSNDARRGDPILQPGPFDGGRLPDDQIAVLEAFVPIRFRARRRSAAGQARENLVDAALGRPLRPEDVSPDILELGPIAGIGRGELGMAVAKSGRTTGVTAGEILQVDVTVDVQYGGGRVARFTDQLMAGAMSQGGDSGSAVLDPARRLVGLLFAGSDATTVINRIEHVLAALGAGLEAAR